MRVLIFSMTCGEGHNTIAKSIEQEYINKLGKKVECKILQTYGFDAKRVEKENKRFLNTCKYIPHLYNFVWNILRKRKPHKDSKIFEREIKDCRDYFESEISNYKPDIIVCTHFYASNILCSLKKNGKLDKNIITSTVLTDYCVHPYWEFSNAVDYVFTPIKENEQQLENKLFNKNQIVCVGIPVKKQASTYTPAEQAKKKVNLNGTNVIIMSGGNGLGNTLKTVKSIIKECSNKVNIIVANAKNQKSKTQIDNYIQKNGLQNIVNLGYVNNLHDYIAASDIVITRGGALSLTEVLCQHKAIIIREKMIINEKINKDIFIKNGCALGMDKTSDAGKLVKMLIDNPSKMQQMSSICKEFAKPNATSDLVDFLIEAQNKKIK